MKRQRHSEEQIIAVLQEAQAGATIEELCRRHGISQGPFEDENRKLKKLVADQALDMMVLASISCATRAKPLVSAQVAEKRMRGAEGSGRLAKTPLVTTTPRGVFLAVAGVLLTWGGDRIVTGERHSVAIAIIGP